LHFGFCKRSSSYRKKENEMKISKRKKEKQKQQQKTGLDSFVVGLSKGAALKQVLPIEFTKTKQKRMKKEKCRAIRPFKKKLQTLKERQKRFEISKFFVPFFFTA